MLAEGRRAPLALRSVPKSKPISATKANPDRAALIRTGNRIRARLAADPGVNKLATDEAELYTVPSFLSAAECERLIAMVEPVARPSTLYTNTGDPAARTSYSGDVDPADPFVRMVTRRIDDLLGIETTWGETFQGQRYQPGQEFRVHCDWFPTDSSFWKKESRLGGQRCWTTMIYLNDVEEGGATDFPYLQIANVPECGTLLAWNNAKPDGEPNMMTLHAGLPVVRGVKYIVTKWYRTRPWGVER